MKKKRAKKRPARKPVIKKKPEKKPVKALFDFSRKLKLKRTFGEKLVERVSTGIIGLDGLMEGGYPKGNLILVTGACGTGKTLFGFNFLMEGCRKNEPGVFVSLEERQGPNKAEMRMFGWEVEALENQKLLLITEPDLYDFDKFLAHIEDVITKVKAKRLVVDSGSYIGTFFDDKFRIRRAMIELEKLLERLGCTGLIINETEEHSERISSYGVEEYIADGVIVLYALRHEGMYYRALAIRKMHATLHSLKIHPMRIKAPGGIIVYPKHRVFEKIVD